MSNQPNQPSTATLPAADLIDAARAGVVATDRVHEVELVDHNGDTVHVPISIVQRAGEIRVEVMREVINESERQATGPIRRAGVIELGSIADFNAYVTRYKTPDVVIFAPLSPPGVTAIFDFHPPAPAPAIALPKAAWCQDRATYKCPLSRQWQLWTKYEGAPFAPVALGDFIEANQLDLTTKDGHASATKMLETARNLVINVGSKYQRTIDPTTGTGTLIVKDEHDEATSTKIPKSFALAIPVFEGDDTHYVVEALVRFTMAEGRPQFAYILQNKEKVLEDALAELRNKVAAGTGAPVFVGTPPAAAR